MRAVSANHTKYRKILAEQAKEIFAPLANRLGIGQIKWSLLDDNELLHHFYFDKGFLVLSLCQCILSPQHWAKGNHFRSDYDKRWAKTDDVKTELHWSRSTLTAMHHPTTQVPIIHSFPSLKTYR